MVKGYINGVFLGEKTTTKGLPQESVLSLLLYCIYTAFITRDLPKDISILAYADDLAVYTRSSSLRIIYEKLNAAMAHFHFMLAEIDLELSCSKSKLCIFGNKGNIKDQNIIKKYSLKVSHLNETVPLVDSVKFLGVIFDRKLTWMEHAKKIVSS